MKVTRTNIADVLVLEPRVFEDPRGCFFESFHARDLAQVGIRETFVQDNHSVSRKNVLRGLHYQVMRPQGKLVRVVRGAAYDVAVDLRQSSATFGRWVGVELSEENKHVLWIPAGFAHGMLALTEQVEMLYKATDYYAPEHERTIQWNDKDLAIEWPEVGEVILSKKDHLGKSFQESEKY